MQFSHVLALFAATAVYAVPQIPDLGGIIPGGDSGAEAPAASPSAAAQDASNVCGNGNKLSCCNSPSGDSVLNILGSSCSLSIPVAGVPLQDTCGAQRTMCCATNQDGLINVGSVCTPVTL